MSWVAVAVAGSAIVGGVVQNDASRTASKTQQDASNKSIENQNQQLALTRADNAPFLQTGTAANSRLAQLLGLARAPGSSTLYQDQKPLTREEFDAQKYLDSYSDVARNTRYNTDPYLHYMTEGQTTGTYRPAFKNNEGTAPDPASSPLMRKFTQADLEADPVYNSGLKFGLDRGTEGINARATASGMYDSGATLKALTQFGNDYGSTKANESYNRFTNDQGNIYNKLAGISGTGQVATGQVAAAGTSAANNISNDITGAGNARAAGIVGGANAWGNAATNANAGYNNYQSNKRLDALLANRSGGGSPYPSGPSQAYYTGYDSSGDYAYG